MQIDGRSGGIFQFLEAADVVYVRVRSDDVFGSKVVFLQACKNRVYVIAGINDDGFARLFGAKNRAVALQEANGKSFDNHGQLPVVGCRLLGTE